jgi:glycerol dehydrogenase
MLPSIVSGFGSNGMLLATPLSTTISFPPYLNDKNANLIVEVFRGECTEKEIQRLVDLGKNAAVGCVIGLGGGKTLDTPRQLSAHLAVPIVICATAASTDAPTSARAVIYNDRGEVLRYLDLPRNPDVVLLDTAIIVQAPVRLLVSGMGDALSTYVEAESCRVKGAPNSPVGMSTQEHSQYVIAKTCYKTLLRYGRAALTSASL